MLTRERLKYIGIFIVSYISFYLLFIFVETDDSKWLVLFGAALATATFWQRDRATAKNIIRDREKRHGLA